MAQHIRFADVPCGTNLIENPVTFLVNQFPQGHACTPSLSREQTKWCVLQ